MQLLKYLNENVKNMTENSKSYKNYSKYYEYHDDFSHAAGSNCWVCLFQIFWKDGSTGKIRKPHETAESFPA